VFLCLVIPLGLVFVFLTPPGDVPDEGAHLLRADALLYGEFVGHRQISTAPDGHTVIAAGVAADPVVAWVATGWPGPAPAWLVVARPAFRWSAHPMFLSIDGLSVYFPLYYIAPAIGLAAAKFLRITPYDAISLARLMGFCLYAVLGLLTLATARYGRAVLFVVLAMPMTLFLGASVNPDGGLIATTCLGFACLTAGRRAAAAACIAALILVKPPYALLSLALLFPLPPLAQFWSARRALLQRFGLVILAVLPGLIWFIWTIAAVSGPEERPAYHAGPLWPGSAAVIFHAIAPAAQLQSVLAHPLAFLRIFVAATFGVWRGLAVETIGVLGYQDVQLPRRLYQLWAVAAAAALLSELPEGPRGRNSVATAALALTAAAGTVLLIWLSQYLNWTNVGEADIIGPSGRYLVPILPIFIFLVPRLPFPGAWGLSAAGVWLPALAALVSLAILPAWFVYHGHLT
jgi:uncharacterized membrane protein